MSDIQGLGPGQPIRPASAPMRPAAPRPPEAVESPSSFGSDAVSVSGAPVAYEIPASPQAPAPAAAPPAAPTSVPARPAFEEIDGFIVAGGGQSVSGRNRGSEAGVSAPTGPIALIDEPVTALPDFPGLVLNGPSTAAEGFFDLSGRRLA